MLNVRGEKVSEALFLSALKEALSQWPGAQLVDYCCAESGIMGKKFHRTLLGITPLFLNTLKACCYVGQLLEKVVCVFFRRFNWRFRSSLPGLFGAQRCEEPQ